MLTTTDWMYLGPNGAIVNRSQFRKFGLKVGELVATMRPAVGVDMMPGDILALLSDGVYDLLPNKELVQKERTLLRYLSTSSGNIDQLKEALFIDYIEDPQDDISVLLLTGGM